jgi:hypothetical protein
VGQVQEKGAVHVGLDHPDRLVGVVVREVALRLEGLAPVEGRRVLERAPQEAVDGIEVLLRVDDIGVVLGQVEAAGHEQALVEALIVRRHAIGPAQMPLSDVNRLVIRLPQQLRQRYLRRRHPHLFVGDLLALAGVVDGRTQPPGHSPGDVLDHRRHPRRRWRELEAEARAVAP